MKALALDIGLKRIGVALYTQNIALPLNAILRKNRNQAAKEIQNLIQEHGAIKLIVGIPKGGSSEEEMNKRIKHFVALLEFKGEVVFVDESFTSQEALKFELSKKAKKDGKLDSLAAYLILKDYFAL